MDEERIVQSALATIRIILGLMLVWAFFDKLIGLNGPTPPGMGVIDGFSPTKDYLMNSTGWASGLMNWFALHYMICDTVMMAILLEAGVCFILGICKKISTLSFCVLMVLFWLSILPTNDLPVVDYHWVYIAGAIAVCYGNGFERWGLEERWKYTWLPTRFPIFE